jgi:hypothetical protein
MPPVGDPGAALSPPLDDLEADVYAARDLHGEERAEVRRTLSEARSQMAEATYRSALVLARDSALLSIEECLDGAAAMEWEPKPRPEFSLETIEAAVAERERDGQRSAAEPDGRIARGRGTVDDRAEPAGDTSEPTTPGAS